MEVKFLHHKERGVLQPKDRTLNAVERKLGVYCESRTEHNLAF
jgi:hypothetical protein